MKIGKKTKWTYFFFFACIGPSQSHILTPNKQSNGKQIASFSIAQEVIPLFLLLFIIPLLSPKIKAKGKKSMRKRKERIGKKRKTSFRTHVHDLVPVHDHHLYHGDPHEQADHRDRILSLPYFSALVGRRSITYRAVDCLGG